MGWNFGSSSLMAWTKGRMRRKVRSFFDPKILLASSENVDIDSEKSSGMILCIGLL